MPDKFHDEPADAESHVKFLARKIVETVKPSDVISRAVQLRQQGHEWRGASPFSGQDSLFISDEHRFYICTVTLKQGDVIRWTMEQGEQAYEEAVRYLATRFLGVRAPL
ncbi:CHC2 zinc finger domain-containing protein [Labrys monachus]|uniref:DNA primase n=1 Tax=Labrys monachus TaxID=217067 RepID=A0ABU0FM68_9HYPH|nr:CHC2 zinc finger domain-containing protein [Labrys monachus]MDQ0395193.1 DNA primase [Labrys monachus]